MNEITTALGELRNPLLIAGIMAANSSSVPRRILRNNGMSPMPSGSRRMTSSVTPGRMVGLIMPTTPRQLEKAMLETSPSGAAQDEDCRYPP